ncbi:glycine cleavage system protein GcvH [Cuneatibacter caecimuris]|uniref:Glycine cleavage system H protein n=1 Tax=Cuneatibacter caecimuris TaxID=1796618 RepID=A0A4Q7P2L0_9FIRM|nr:glycine cleavage system protein GcvH [Cuneatibacter caecimuris]RZS94131.1 glycine cleavage system H protein [Cuneatibacter caecimuris]
MNFPKDLKYSKSHEWVKQEGTQILVGLTDYAQDALGDLVFVNLPEPGDALRAGEALGDVESVKAVSDIISPVDGTVAEINETLLDAPETINQSPYEAWLIRVKDIFSEEDLMNAEEYESFCAAQT